MSTLVVTTAIGRRYLVLYNTLFRRSQERYAKRHGYDFRVITEFLDSSHREHQVSTYFQKMLLCSQPWSGDYDFILFIDSDILIHPEAPPLSSACEFGERIGVIDEYSQPSPERRLQLQEQMGWERSATEYYKLSGFDLSTQIVPNGGVLVMQPTLHREFLEQVYTTYLPRSLNHERGAHFEQASTGYALQTGNNYALLSPKWNAIWAIHKLCYPEYSLARFYSENYFTHFAGHTDFHLVSSL